MVIDAHIHIFSHTCPRVAPPQFADERFPVDRLLSLMHREGVDKAVIVQNPAPAAQVLQTAAAHYDLSLRR